MNLEAILSEYDFVVAIDRSGSMGNDDMNGRTRWKYMQETLTSFVRDVEKLDDDGVDVVLFGGSDIITYEGVTSKKVDEIFASQSPRGSTPLTEALTTSLKLAGKSSKKDFVLVFTDGVPNETESAKKVIRDAAEKLTKDDELTFLFVQVGYDRDATSFLKTLDDGLNARFDIVDCKTIDEAEKFASTAELIAAAIND